MHDKFHRTEIKNYQEMKIKISLILLLCACSFLQVKAQSPQDTENWSIKPPIVNPGKNNTPPSDAIILYNGKDCVNKWTDTKGNNIEWKTKGKVLTVEKNKGMIVSKDNFGDMQLHIEWRSPKKVIGEGQGRGNSGIFIMGLYEVQILDSYKNETYSNGQAGSLYKQFNPLVNVCRRSGKWQAYDIIFTAPKFNSDKTLKSPAYVSVIHNGILIQNHVELKGPTLYIGQPEYKYHEAKLPVMLQEHGNPVSFRNIWIREL